MNGAATAGTLAVRIYNEVSELMAQEQMPDHGASAGQPLPGAGPIADACRRAAAHNFGSTLIADPMVTPVGVRVRLPSRQCQQEALRALRALGYQAAEDGRDDEHGAALIVTGWSTRRLTARAEQLEAAVRYFDQNAPAMANTAVSRFRNFQTAEGWDDADAQGRIVAEARQVALTTWPGLRSWSAPVDEHDRLQASGGTRALLDRVAAGEAAVARMAAAAEHIAGAAIGLFLSSGTSTAATRRPPRPKQSVRSRSARGRCLSLARSVSEADFSLAAVRLLGAGGCFRP
jgi:hypothetical protein